jgi:hypothetical protein
MQKSLLALPLVALIGLLVGPMSVYGQTSQRNAFPGRRVGGATRGECAARLLAHLVPVNSVFAPGSSLTVGLLEGPSTNPRPLMLEFLALKSDGSPNHAKPAMSPRLLPPAQVGVTLFNLPSLPKDIVWESSYRCDGGPPPASDPLSFVQSVAPPAISLLVANPISSDLPIQAGLKKLSGQCGSTVSRNELAQVFGFEDLMALGWPEQVPVRCL